MRKLGEQWIEEISEIIKYNTNQDCLTTKKDILNKLRIKDTRENREILTKVTDELKKEE